MTLQSLAARLGMTEDQLNTLPPVDGPVFETHREFAAQQAQKRRGYETDMDCLGALRIVEHGEHFNTLVCDACRFEVCVPNRETPTVERSDW